MTAGPEPAAVAAAVATWATGRFGGPVHAVGPAVAFGEGFDTLVVAALLDGDALPDAWRGAVVLRAHPSATRAPIARREAAVQSFVADAGYPAPRVLAVLEPDETPLGLPVQVMERVPGRTLLGVMTSRPWRIPHAARTLGVLHARLHALPVAGWPGGHDLPARRLALVRGVIAADALPGLRLDLTNALEALDPVITALATDESVICHGDFHPLNVVASGRSAAVVDWTDACLGDRHGDVARLLTLLRAAPVAAPSRVARPVLASVVPRFTRRYLRTYESAAGVSLDPVQLARWIPVHLLHDWTRAALSGERVAAGTVAWIEARFHAALAAAREGDPSF